VGDPWGAAIGAEMTACPVGLGLAGQGVSAWDDDSMDRGVAVDQLVELRSYALVPGQVEAFVEHFELHFLASQEELGMDVVGQFTVPGDDARFVWVRRFLEPSARGDALARFYGGPVWKEFGPRANELMVDHTDVHLLVPHRSAPAFAADHVPHAQRRTRVAAAGLRNSAPSSWPPSMSSLEPPSHRRPPCTPHDEPRPVAG
jgi:NIPSNAP